MEENIESVATEQVAAPIAEVQEQGVSQVAAEEHKPSDVEINWQRANETLRAQSQEIKRLNERLATIQPKAEADPNDLFTGRDHDDLLTVGDYKKVAAKSDQETRIALQELKTRTLYPDFDNVISEYGKNLTPLMVEMVKNSSNPHMLAYELCLPYKNASSQPNVNAKRIADNLQKPGNASAVGSTGALSKASLYQNMNDKEILELSRKYMNGG